MLTSFDGLGGWRASSHVLALGPCSSALLSLVSTLIAGISSCDVVELSSCIALLYFSVSDSRHHFRVCRVLGWDMSTVLAGLAVGNWFHHIIRNLLECRMLATIAFGTMGTIELIGLLSCRQRRVCRVYTAVSSSACGKLRLVAILLLTLLVLRSCSTLSHCGCIILQVWA